MGAFSGNHLAEEENAGLVGVGLAGTKVGGKGGQVDDLIRGQVGSEQLLLHEFAGTYEGVDVVVRLSESGVIDLEDSKQRHQTGLMNALVLDG